MNPGKIASILWIVSVTAVAGFVLFPSTGRDDVHITYWAAHSLAEFGEILNYNGLRLEQSTSLLHTLVLAGLKASTGISLPNLGLLLSALCAIVAVLLTLRLFRSHFMAEGGEVELCLLLITSTFFLYWSTGALEASMAALMLVWFTQSSLDLVSKGPSKKQVLSAVIACAAFFLVRPENVVIVFCFLAALFPVLLVWSRSPRIDLTRKEDRGLLILVGVVVAVSAVVLGLRYAYFGSLFPHTVYAKSGSLSLGTVKAGAKYLFAQMISPYLFIDFLLCIAGAFRVTWRLWKSDPRDRFSMNHFLIMLYLAVYFAFVVTSGGDWMEGGRLLVPILPLLFILVWYFLRPLRYRRPLLTLLIAYHVIAVFAFATKESTARPLWMLGSLEEVPLPAGFSFAEKANAVHLRDIPLTEHVGRLVGAIAAEKNEQVVILSDYAGMVIYHLSREHFPNLVFIDRYGLTTDHVKSCQNYDSFHRRSRGVVVGYRSWLGGRCDIPEVDIIMTYSGSERRVGSHGYTVVHRQSGVIMSYDWPFGKRTYSPRLYVAVKDEYLDALSAQGLASTEWKWDL